MKDLGLDKAEPWRQVNSIETFLKINCSEKNKKAISFFFKININGNQYKRNLKNKKIINPD